MNFKFRVLMAASLAASLTAFRKCETKFESKVPITVLHNMSVSIRQPVPLQARVQGCGGLRLIFSMRGGRPPAWLERTSLLRVYVRQK